jgi:hypothetical protein
MDHSIPYSRCYASDSDDDGPDEDLDEDGLMAKEAERSDIFKKVTGRDIRITLYRDVSLADGAVVDGCKSLLLGARPISHRDVDHKTNGIVIGLTFEILLEFKVWIKEFSIKHHCSYTVVHSDLMNGIFFLTSIIPFRSQLLTHSYCTSRFCYTRHYA